MKDYEKLREEKVRCEARIREIDEALRDEPVELYMSSEGFMSKKQDLYALALDTNNDRQLHVFWPFEPRILKTGRGFEITLHRTR